MAIQSHDYFYHGYKDVCDSVCTEGRLLTGDSLLKRGCGRIDFQQGDQEKLFDRMTQKLYAYLGKTLSIRDTITWDGLLLLYKGKNF